MCTVKPALNNHSWEVPKMSAQERCPLKSRFRHHMWSGSGKIVIVFLIGIGRVIVLANKQIKNSRFRRLKKTFKTVNICG